MKDIVDYIHRNSWFQLDGDLEDFEDSDELIFATRDNGNVGDERFGHKDFEEAKRIMKEVRGQFGGIMYHDITTCDEWVNIEITLE